MSQPFTKTKSALSAIAGLLVVLVASYGQAAIILDARVNFTTDPNPNQIVRPGPWTFTNASLGGFDPTGSDKLVVAFAGENQPSTAPEVRYGGVLLTPIEYGNGGSGGLRSAIYYLDSPTVNGDLVFNFTAGNGIGGTLFALSGTADGFLDSNLTSGASTSVTVDANSFVIAAAVKNQGTPPEAQGDLDPAASTGSGSSAVGTGFQDVASAGTLNPTFNNSPVNVSAVSFTIPEPASLILLGIGSGLILVRRSRG